jgi:hypothetical protein
VFFHPRALRGTGNPFARVFRSSICICARDVDVYNITRRNTVGVVHLQNYLV